MDMAASPAPGTSSGPVGWDGARLDQLLLLDRIGEGHWRSRAGDPNPNGRSFGGQLLGQAAMAALREIPPERQPTMMQVLFLRGADPHAPIDFQVERLQEGRRFSSRRVQASQKNGRTVLDVQFTCAVALDAPAHDAEPCIAPVGEHPEDLPTLADLPAELFESVRCLGGYDQQIKPSIDLRVPDARAQMSAATARPRFRYWIRTAQPLPDDPRLHMAAFAYLSDWWVNFCALVPHLTAATKRPLYISSLNHGLWMQRAVRPDGWLHVESHSPAAALGRGMSFARVHDMQGRLVACASQQSQMVFAD